MLETENRERLTKLLQHLPRRVAIPAEWDDFFEKSGMMPPVINERRRFARKHLRMQAVCEVSSTLPAIDRQHAFHRIYLRDISRGGIGFMHHEQLFPDERVVLWTDVARIPVKNRTIDDLCFLPPTGAMVLSRFEQFFALGLKAE